MLRTTAGEMKVREAIDLLVGPAGLEQPDRYERPALTIELQAPPRDGPRERAAGNGAGFVHRLP